MKVQGFQNVFIEILCYGRESFNAFFLTVFANTDRHIFDNLLWVKEILTFSTLKIRRQASLVFADANFHHTHKDDDNAVTSIGRFVTDSCIVCCFARLNIAQHKTAALKWCIALWVAEVIYNFIGNRPKSTSNARIPVFDFFQIFFASVPKEEIQN